VIYLLQFFLFEISGHPSPRLFVGEEGFSEGEIFSSGIARGSEANILFTGILLAGIIQDIAVLVHIIGIS